MNYKSLSAIPKAYSAVMFINHPAAGLIFLALTCYYLDSGITGLIAVVTGLCTLQLFKFNEDTTGTHLLNCLLVGLSLGAFFHLNIFLVLLVTLSSVITVFLSIVISDAFWRFGKLPQLSLPFIFISGIASLISINNKNFISIFHPLSGIPEWFGPRADIFFSTIGATFFSPHPVIGCVIFICIVLYSRYLALLALCGYIAGLIVFTLLLHDPQPYLISWSGFNFILTAMALGGIYTVPGLSSFGFAMLGACLAALLSAAIQKTLLMHGLPILALPFIISTLILLAAIGKRTKWSSLWLATEPGPPEINYERSRLAVVRNGGQRSIPLLAPFFGEWNIYQGFNGNHTHKSPWQHALDFFKLEDEKSFSSNGENLQDYFCYGVPVLSPVYGVVVRVVEDVPDNKPGEINTRNNWGNLLLIRLESGLHVLLAHLSQDSIKVKEGDWVTPGTPVASCGNSGRSPQPHLHLQVQQDATLGSPTVPFHLCSIICSNSDYEDEYKIASVPNENDRIEPAELDHKLASQLHFPVGRTLRYKIEGSDIEENSEYTIRVDVTLNGQFRFVSDNGASVAFTEQNGVLALYDRRGPDNLLIDMWTLGLGLTPLSERATCWEDSPSTSLLPLTIMQKIMLMLASPLGNGLSSRYDRTWQYKNHQWIQQAEHKPRLSNTNWSAKTEVILTPDVGCSELKLEFGDQQWHARLTETGLTEDSGIPRWSRKLPVTKTGKEANKFQNGEDLT